MIRIVGYLWERLAYRNAMSIALLTPESGLTFPCRKYDQTYPKRKLRSSDNPKPNRDGTIPLGRGVYPVRNSLGISS